MVNSLARGRKINIAGGTGNRLDKDIFEFGKIIGKIYDHIFITDADPRKRARGETARIVQKGALSTGLSKKNVKIVFDERKAIAQALKFAKEGDLVVIQADNVNRVIEDVKKFKRSIKGFALSDCPDVFGDTIERAVSWKGGPDVGNLAGKPVRLRFVMKDADLYSLRFQ